MAKLICVGVLLFGANVSHALLIDFTDADLWGAVDGVSSHSVNYDGGLAVTVRSLQDPAVRPLTFNAPGPSGPGFLENDGDGIGVGPSDEISYLEPGDNNDLLEVVFNQDVAVVAYYFYDLFANEGPNGEPEAAFVNFGRTGPNTVFTDLGTATDRIGFYGREGIAVANFAEVRFSALNGMYSDYALAGIRIAPVPEPGSLGLLGLGLLAIMFFRRMRS